MFPSRDSDSLTKQQRRILDAILFFLHKGELPTVREVGALVGLRSPATVLKHLRALEQRKLISLSGKSRGIRITITTITGISGISGLSPGKARRLGIPLLGAIAAGRPFESYSDGFMRVPQDVTIPDGVGEEGPYRQMLIAPLEISEGGTPETGEEAPADGRDPEDRAPQNRAGYVTSSHADLPLDPGMFVESGEVFALKIQGDSMLNAGILDGDYVMIRRQESVEEGEIAAVIINGEGTLKRWHVTSSGGKKSVTLEPANERFEPIEITEENQKEVLVIGKYVGLVRGNLRFV